ncbi:hypothetical protein Slin15195_G021490 [Septoria linicola]|uniref:Asl1-like glycosyl hydrolase catalytic domain-containing protein n=1 Tax=Septoria linicola TaxID=215465 RepID=A0A9Q9AGU7_9PEZI|nr:hypothetical protein Slin15195_G021490 [Septoria linicola]
MTSVVYKIATLACFNSAARPSSHGVFPHCPLRHSGCELLSHLCLSSPRTTRRTLQARRQKAGVAGGRALPYWKYHLGWWYDWTPAPDSNTNVLGVSMLWGDGQNGPQDSRRFNEFQSLKSTPPYVLGFNEPDCTGQDVSSNLSVKDGIHW